MTPLLNFHRIVHVLSWLNLSALNNVNISEYKQGSLPKILFVWSRYLIRIALADPVEAGGPDPLKNHKLIGFLSNTGLDPLKKHKATSQHSMLGHHRPANETPFK